MSISAEDPFLVALKTLPPTRTLPANLAAALLRVSDLTFHGWNLGKLPSPTSTMVEGRRQHAVRDLLAFLHQHPEQREQPDMRHPTFEAFLTHGSAEDVWLFGFISVDFEGMRRPVDTIACLDLPEHTTRDVECRLLSLTEYLMTMSAYTDHFHAQDNAERTADDCAQRGMSIHDVESAVTSIDRQRS